MILVLDTSALFHREFLETLAAARGAGLVARGTVVPVLPAVAHGERLRQLRRDGKDEAAWLQRLQDTGMVIEPFGQVEAARLPGADDRTWAQHARDYLVAAHLGGDRIAVTSDGGPHWTGRACWKPDQAVRAIRALLPESEGSP